MKKVKCLLKQNIKVISAFVTGIVLSGGSVYAAIMLSSSEVSYNNNGQSTVGGALDNLYTLASAAANKECQDGYYRVDVEDGTYYCKDFNDLSFATSSWSDIVTAYNAGATTQLQADMEAGVTRDITLGGDFGTHPVRITNLTPCSETNTISQTACGLVIEFADIITEYQMNPYNENGDYMGDGNKGGWEYSDMRGYLNSASYMTKYRSSTIFNILSSDYVTTGIYSNMPSDLKPLIISTSVVSGHGSNDSANFTTDDYMYLLSNREVWNYQDVWDTASETDSVTNKAYTRQLDYYNTKGVTTSSYSAAIKQRNGINSSWWLRSAGSNVNNNFYIVYSDGYYYLYGSNNSTGVSPAFRLSSGIDFNSVNFATSSWNDIIEAYHAGATTQLQADMEAGVTRDITLGGVFGTHSVRIANLTSCSAVNLREPWNNSACGLVIEFADIISTHRMNPEGDDGVSGYNNTGGWERSDMRAYVNSDMYAAENIDYSSTGVYSNLPGDLKSLIVRTGTVSGSGPENYDIYSQDNVYLLSPQEVVGSNAFLNSNIDTSFGLTRQLDYYERLSDDPYYKNYTFYGESYPYRWWLRSAARGSNYDNKFFVVEYGTARPDGTCSSTSGVSPAFRLAN